MLKLKSLNQQLNWHFFIRFLVAIWQFENSRCEYKLKRDQVTKLAFWQVALLAVKMSYCQTCLYVSKCVWHTLGDTFK